MILFTGLPFSVHAAAQTVYADVNGLVCDFCARALDKVFSKQKAVENIDVNLSTKVIAIHFKEGQGLSDEEIAKLINNAGYSVVKIRHEAEASSE